MLQQRFSPRTVDSVHAVTFLSSARVKASLSRWWLLFHLSVSVWMTVGSCNGNGRNLYMCTKRWGQITFSFSRSILTLNFGQLHPLDVHNAATSRHKSGFTKSRVPSSPGIVRHEPVKSVFGLVWAWGIMVGLVCSLQSFMFAHWRMGKFMAGRGLSGVSSFNRWEAPKNSRKI